MRFRKLRIAWLIACVLMCQPLLVLWALSYSEIDHWHVPLGSSHGLWFWTVNGRISACPSSGPQESVPVREEVSAVVLGDMDRTWPRWNFGTGGQWTVPIWFPVMLVAALAVAPWIRWSTRFGLRTILILTTFVAAVLGLIVYSMGK